MAPRCKRPLPPRLQRLMPELHERARRAAVRMLPERDREFYCISDSAASRSRQGHEYAPLARVFDAFLDMKANGRSDHEIHAVLHLIVTAVESITDGTAPEPLAETFMQEQVLDGLDDAIQLAIAQGDREKIPHLLQWIGSYRPALDSMERSLVYEWHHAEQIPLAVQ